MRMGDVRLNDGCSCCEYTTEVTFYGTYKIGPHEYNKWLCKLCANTHIPNFMEYRELYTEEAGINGRALMYAMNVILDKLEKIEKRLDNVTN